MVLFGDIYNEVIDAMRAWENPEEQARALRRLNQDMFAIAMKDSWADLRRKLTISWTGDAYQLPGDLAGIDLIWDDNNQIAYLPRNRDAAQRNELAYRYYLYPVGSDLATADDVDLAQDSTSMSSTTLAASGATYEDEYVMFNGEQQVYQITAFDSDTDLFTISPAYRGQGNVYNAKAVVRPARTPMLFLTGPDDTVIPSSSVDIYYWQLPTMLRDPHDIVPFPTSDVLTFRTMSRLPTTRKLRPISQTQVDAALTEALAMNPDKPIPRVAQNLQGTAINFSQAFYRPLSHGYRLRENRVRDQWHLNRIS